MKLRILLCAGALLLALAIGFLFPDALLRLTDGKLDEREWALATVDDTFSYAGTLENRVAALDAWQSASPNIRYSADNNIADYQIGDAWSALYDAGLLPVTGDGARYEITAFTLSPMDFSAEYAFIDVRAAADAANLHIIIDAVTGAYLRFDFICDDNLLTDWMAKTGEGFNTVYKPYEMLDNYAALSGLGEVRDLNGLYTNGEAIQAHEVEISGTVFKMSLRYSLSQGLIMMKISMY